MGSESTDDSSQATTGTLEPNLTIGATDGPEEYVFGQVRGAALGLDGSVLVLDEQALVVRRYDRDGSYVGSIGGPGNGPGEFPSESGLTLAVAPDGRVLVAQLTTGIVHFYSPDGAFQESWDLGGPLDEPVMIDENKNVYARLPGIWAERWTWASDLQAISPDLNAMAVIHADRLPEAAFGILEIGPDGEIMDTIPAPDLSEAGSYVEVEGGRVYLSFDLVPQEWWAFSPTGTFLTGRTDRYRIEIRSRARAGEGPEVLAKIERPEDRIRLSSAERATVEAQFTVGENRIFERETPTHKPAYHRVFVGLDGAIWVMRHVESEAFEIDGDRAWRETATSFDLFTPSGEYIGELHGPPGILPLAIRGDTVLARTRDEFGVDRVVRLEANWTP